MPVDAKVGERYSSPFAPLQLSQSAADELKRLADVFVASRVHTYERHLFAANGVVDETKWKFMYQKDDVRSYTERPNGASSSSTTTGTVAINASTTSSSDKLPVVLVAGTISGELDDTIYGLMCPTIDLMRIKTSYVHDTLVRGSVLAPLIKPSTSDPYRSLTIKWMEKGQRAHTRAVISNRDFVYMESTGVEYLKNGERVGFHLVHSVQFPETPPRESAIRGNMSMCAIYREQGSGVTEVFLKGFLNPAGGIVRSIITRSVARALVSVAKNVHCASMKNLMWAVRHQQHQVPSKDAKAKGPALDASNDTGDDQELKQRVPVSINEPCPSCEKFPSRITRLRALATGISKAKRRCCKLCRQPVCSGCRVDHKLSFLLEDRRLVQLPCAFCVQCMERVLAIKSMEVARDEIAIENEFHRWQDKYTGSSHSGSSSGPEFTFIDELN